MPNRRDPDVQRGLGGTDLGSVAGLPPSWPAGIPGSLADLPWSLPPTFLGADPVALADADAVILPVPYESTTSWGGGTRWGPTSLLEASRYVELYDRELGREPAADIAIATLPALELSRAGGAEAMDELREAYRKIVDEAPSTFVVALGGEHSVSAPMIQVCSERAEGRLSVLQMDAHADLRRDYEGTPHSHASAMARVLPSADVVAVGVRGVSREEVEASRAASGSMLIWADEMTDGDEWMDRAIDALGPKVYLTFDVDYLDPSIMPATGTPEPGGADWYGTLRFLRRICAEREVVAADVVELAPVPGLRAPDFTVAKLVYKLIAYRFMRHATRASVSPRPGTTR